MSGPAFFQTVMGNRFFEHTMPELVRQISELNKNLITLNTSLAKIAKKPKRKTVPLEKGPMACNLASCTEDDGRVSCVTPGMFRVFTRKGWIREDEQGVCWITEEGLATIRPADDKED